MLLSLGYRLSELKIPGAAIQLSRQRPISISPSQATPTQSSKLKRPVVWSSSRFRAWLITLVAIAIVGVWNWPVLLAIGAGLLGALLGYRAQTWNWQELRSHLHNVLQQSDRRFVFAVGSGGVAALSTYLAVLVWLDSKNFWIAAGTVLQGLGTFAILVLLFWRTIQQPERKQSTSFNQHLMNLAHPDPLRRLVAVHQLQQLLEARPDSQDDRRIAEYFRLMLRCETEAVIQDAILDSLQSIENSQKLNSAENLFLPPLTTQRHPAKVKVWQSSKTS